MKESDLQVAVADYLRLKYPDVLFHSDFGSGIKMTKGQAIKQKRQNGGRRGWPDMFIAQPRELTSFNVQQNRDIPNGKFCHGMFLELKKDGTRLFKKDGSPASEHIAEQVFVMESLRIRGYYANFAIGFEQAKKLIDWYLGGNNGKVEF